MATPPQSDQDVASAVMEIIAKEGLVDRARISLQATLEDLEVESVDMLMILQEIEEHYDLYIPMDETTAKLKTVGDLIALVETLLAAKAAGPAT